MKEDELFGEEIQENDGNREIGVQDNRIRSHKNDTPSNKKIYLNSTLHGSHRDGRNSSRRTVLNNMNGIMPH